MSQRMCPWWMGYLIDNPIRRLIHDPRKLIGPYLKPGMKVLDIGCGMGFLSIGMARLVGEGGRVTAVDVQTKMLEGLRRRAAKAGVDHRIEVRRAEVDRLGLSGLSDFAVALNVVHEVPDARKLLAEVRDHLRPGARFLVAEPAFHVDARAFEKTVRDAEETGFDVVERPSIRLSRAVLLAKPAGPSHTGAAAPAPDRLRD